MDINTDLVEGDTNELSAEILRDLRNFIKDITDS